MSDETKTPAPATVRKAPRRMSNKSKATTVGMSAGGLGSGLIAWGAPILEAKTGMPAPLAAALLGTLFVFVSRWAAKLTPDG